MDNKQNIDLTATEIGYLWSTYQAETLSQCMLTYFDSIVEDPEIKQLNAYTLESCKSNISKMKKIFEHDNFPIPIGFNESDVKIDGDRLYTDPFILYYQWFIGKGSMNFGSLAINTIAREDVFEFYEGYTTKALSILKDARRILLSKGLWIRAPYIPIPTKVEFVKKESFLSGWLGEDRPLAGIEIASLFYNIITNSLGLSLLNSFLQVTKKGEVHDYFLRGKLIAQKHIDVLSKALRREDLPMPSTWNTGITATNESPFSEKLMLFLVTFLNAQGLSNYGNAVSNSLRRDVGIDFTRLAAEVAEYGEDGAKLIINKGWMETPPHAKKRIN